MFRLVYPLGGERWWATHCASGSRLAANREPERICWKTNGRSTKEQVQRPALSIEWADNPAPAAVEDVRVDHGRAHVLVSEQLLHGADVVARL
jgi:hypothetical protein